MGLFDNMREIKPINDGRLGVFQSIAKDRNAVIDDLVKRQDGLDEAFARTYQTADKNDWEYIDKLREIANQSINKISEEYLSNNSSSGLGSLNGVIPKIKEAAYSFAANPVLGVVAKNKQMMDYAQKRQIEDPSLFQIDNGFEGTVDKDGNIVEYKPNLVSGKGVYEKQLEVIKNIAERGKMISVPRMIFDKESGKYIQTQEKIGITQTAGGLRFRSDKRGDIRLDEVPKELLKQLLNQFEQTPEGQAKRKILTNYEDFDNTKKLSKPRNQKAVDKLMLDDLKEQLKLSADYQKTYDKQENIVGGTGSKNENEIYLTNLEKGIPTTLTDVSRELTNFNNLIESKSNLNENSPSRIQNKKLIDQELKRTAGIRNLYINILKNDPSIISNVVTKKTTEMLDYSKNPSLSGPGFIPFKQNKEDLLNNAKNTKNNYDKILNDAIKYLENPTENKDLLTKETKEILDEVTKSKKYEEFISNKQKQNDKPIFIKGSNDEKNTLLNNLKEVVKINSDAFEYVDVNGKAISASNIDMDEADILPVAGGKQSFLVKTKAFKEDGTKIPSQTFYIQPKTGNNDINSQMASFALRSAIEGIKSENEVNRNNAVHVVASGIRQLNHGLDIVSTGGVNDGYEQEIYIPNKTGGSEKVTIRLSTNKLDKNYYNVQVKDAKGKYHFLNGSIQDDNDLATLISAYLLSS